MNRTLTATLTASILFAGCAADAGLSDEGEEFVDDAQVVPAGKADDFLSLTARELVVSGTTTVTLEAEYEGRSEAERMARVQELVSLRQLAISWFLNQYLVDKESEDSNADYGGFGAMAKAGDYAELDIAQVDDTLTYSFTFQQVIAGQNDLTRLLPLTEGPDGTRVFTLTVGTPTNEEMARLETNHEWYRSSPWSAWNPSAVADDRKEDLVLAVRPETESNDAWFDYQRLFEDGVLDIDVHFGWDYHANYHVTHARELFTWLQEQGFEAPVATFDELRRDSGPFVRSLDANGQTIRVEVRVFYGHAGGETDPDTDAGGRVLEEDARHSLATRDVIIYSGHSGPFYGFALGNWRMTDEGDLDDSELSSVEMPSDRSQIVFAEGCDTYQLGAAFARNPAHPDLAGLDVITTTSFSNAATPKAAQDFISRLIERDSHGHHRPRTVSSLLSDLDDNGGWGFHTMYGIHGVDDDLTLHPYADLEMMGEECAVNADCGGLGNLCVRQLDGSHACSAACTADAGCPADMACRQIGSSRSRAIYGSACVPR